MVKSKKELKIIDTLLIIIGYACIFREYNLTKEEQESMIYSNAAEDLVLFGVSKIMYGG